MNKYSSGSVAFRVLAFAILAILIFHENVGISDRAEDCSGREDRSGELRSFDYNLLLSLSTYKDPNDESVRIVTLSSGTEPDEILTNVCRQRLFLSKLIGKLTASRVSEIVLDKRYSASACLKDSAGSDALAASIQKSGAPVVVGLDSDFVPLGRSVLLAGRRTCLRTRPHLSLQGASFGLIRLDRDTRRVPLKWPAFGDDGTSPQLVSTLSLQAAQLANADIVERRRLKRILSSGRQPFSRFNTSIKQYSALRLLCGASANVSTLWESCSDDSTPETRELNGKIVVIGDHSDADRHESTVGVSYGVDLQANYIAAILADDLYIPLLDNVNGAIFAVLWFVLVQVIFFANHNLFRALMVCLAIWASIFLASVCLLAFGGYMLTFWFQGVNLTSIGLTWMEHWLHRLQSDERPGRRPPIAEAGSPFTGFDSVS